MCRRVILISSIMIMVACYLGGLGILSSGDAIAQTRTFNFASGMPEPDIRSQAFRYWADLISKRTEGRIKFQGHYAGSLASLPEIFGAISQGVIEGGDIVASFYSGVVPDVMPFELLYTYNPMKWKALDARLRPIMDDILKEHNVKYLTGEYIGNSTYSSRKKAITTLADFKNLKIRTAGKWQTEALILWGAKPVMVPPAELYTSIQTGIVDTVALAYSLVDSFRIYEVAPYITDVPTMPNWQAFAMNLKVWNSLSGEDQKIITETAEEMRMYLDEKGKAFDDEIRKKLEAKGAKINYLSAEEEKNFRNAVKPLQDQVRKLVGARGNKIMDLINLSEYH
jgi:TRAP-type transport system periplasmic protein